MKRRDTPLHGALAGEGSSFQEALIGLASGVVFGLVSPLVGHPLDTVKTRMQVCDKMSNHGFYRTVRDIYLHDGGMRGFYRGFLPPLLGSMMYRGMLFSAYSGTYAACSHVPVLQEPIPMTGGLRGSVLMGALAAAVARASIESPLDFIKVRLMLGKHVHDTGPKSTVETLKHFVQSPLQSVQHLYHGFGATLLRTIGLLSSFFVMVDYSIRYIPDVVNAPFVGPFFKGGVCATAAWVIAFPFESAKSYIQADNTGKYKNIRGSTFVVLRKIYTEKGIMRGWYRGFGPGAGRSFVANGVSMSVYAWFQDLVREKTDS